MNGKRKSEETKREKKNFGNNKRYFQSAPVSSMLDATACKTAEHEVQSTDLLLTNVLSAGLRKKENAICCD